MTSQGFFSGKEEATHIIYIYHFTIFSLCISRLVAAQQNLPVQTRKRWVIILTLWCVCAGLSCCLGGNCWITFLLCVKFHPTPDVSQFRQSPCLKNYKYQDPVPPFNKYSVWIEQFLSFHLNTMNTLKLRCKASPVSGSQRFACVCPQPCWLPVPWLPSDDVFIWGAGSRFRLKGITTHDLTQNGGSTDYPLVAGISALAAPYPFKLPLCTDDWW